MTNFLGIEFQFQREAIDKTLRRFIETNVVDFVCLVNANTVTVANKNLEFKNIINQSGVNICDGSLVALSYRMIYKKPAESYPGPDLFIDYLSKKEFTSYFLGSTEEILVSLKQKLTKHDPKIANMTFYSPPFIPLDDFDYEEIGQRINESNADIIWVSLGAPKQEEFMYRLKPYLDKGVMIGVGAAFTFYGDDNLKRAPEFIRNMKLEWLYRTLKDPKKSFPRLKRQIYDMPKLIYNEMKKKHTEK